MPRRAAPAARRVPRASSRASTTAGRDASAARARRPRARRRKAAQRPGEAACPIQKFVLGKCYQRTAAKTVSAAEVSVTIC